MTLPSFESVSHKNMNATVFVYTANISLHDIFQHMCGVYTEEVDDMVSHMTVSPPPYSALSAFVYRSHNDAAETVMVMVMAMVMAMVLTVMQ